MRRYLFLLLFSLSNHNTSMTEQNLSLFHSIRNEHFELYILDTRIPWSAILNFLFCALEGHGRCGNVGMKNTLPSAGNVRTKSNILIHFMHITHLAGPFLPLACYFVTFCYILRIFVQMSSIFLTYLYIFCLIFFYPSFFLLLSFLFYT